MAARRDFLTPRKGIQRDSQTRAVFTAETESRVFVVSDGRAHERSVRIGHRSDGAVEILDGVNDGDIVVLFPSDRVRDRTRVEHRLAGSP